MSKKAIIYDLDNTIYPVPSIGHELFASLFQLIEESNAHNDNMDAIRGDIMRRPFQVVAAHYNFSRELTQQGMDLLKDLTYEGIIEPFGDYAETRDLPVENFLVTTGFLKLQWSKIKGMGIEQDFREIHVVDPDVSDKTKKDVFADIMKRYGYSTSEVIVVGDDPHSEIKAAGELGIDAVLYDKYERYPDENSLPKISDFKQLRAFI